MNPATTYQTQSPDTSIEGDKIWFTGFQRMTLLQKANLLRGATQGCRRLALIGIQQQFPDCSPQEKRIHYVRRILGETWAELTEIWNLDTEIMLGDPIALALTMAAIFENLNIDYYIGGSVASSLWGENRATLDLDLVADLKTEQIPAFLQAIQTEFYVSEMAIQEAIIHQSSFNLIHFQTNEKIDIFVHANNPLAQIEMQRRQQITVDAEGKQIYLATAEDIILQKLIWYELSNRIGDRQWRDILGVLKVQAQQLDFAYLQQWAEHQNLLDLLNEAMLAAGLDRLNQ
jgi:hypothetical protein